ncbi:hypothetical protein LMH87_003734 [Akanthomyces muscarius]|uniref:Probable endonuclease LCL3 n=1 Tax=Akanthomyces muscarius TaxID=2231603 RepID=A0A9W8Q3V9_AKAMU|nr:hypothetical protein LMH87_003734 [Akanthomyces muscarius]KAJ4144866.1 hypothetical protein LMH87_003734 [Akanthomyces muscarius]
MVWPFGSSPPDRDKPEPSDKRRPIEWDKSLGEVASPFDAAKQWAPVVITSLVGLGALQLYANYLRRIPGAAFIKQSAFRKKTLFGRVTSVGDGDGFHLFHTPGGRAVGWGWLRKVPEKRRELKDRTISIRLAGIDAPEGAHFGRPAQPYADEAMKWLTEYILHRNVRAHIYKRDQYSRVVATVYVWRFLTRRNVGLELVKRGLATTYEAKSGAEFGGLRSVYEKAEAKAKRKKLGMWSGSASEFESPRAYKSRYSGNDGE